MPASNIYNLKTLLGISLIWIALVFYVLQLLSQNSIYIDCSTYLKSAQLLVYDFKPHQWRPIGMAVYAAIPGVFGQDYLSVFTYVKLINVLVWLTGIAFLFLTLQQFVTSKKAFWWSLVYVSCVGIVILNNLLLSEIPWITIMLIGVYGLTIYKAKQNYWWLAVGVSAILISILIRPISKFIIILLIVLYWKDIWNLLKTNACILIIGSSLLLVGQCSMMKQTYGDFTVSYIDYYTLYHYVVEPAVFERFEFDNYKQFSDRYMIDYFNEPYASRKAYAKRAFWREIQINPMGIWSVYKRHMFENLTASSLYIVDAKNLKNTSVFKPAKTTFFWLAHVQNVLFSFIGILAIGTTAILFFRKILNFRDDKLILFIALWLCYTMAVIGISAEQYDRLNIPNYAIIILLSTMLLSKLKRVENV